MDQERDSKECYGCKIIKPLVKFYIHSGKRDGRASRCITCTKAIYKEKYDADVEYQRQRQRDYHAVDSALTTRRRAKRRYGISFAEYDELELLQDAKCAICSTTNDLQVDHDHQTEVVRGLLCGPCNRGLGHFRDDVALMQKALNYLVSKKDGWK